MTLTTSHHEKITQRAANEFRKLAFIFLYLYIIFGAIILMKAGILHAHGISFTPWGIAAVKAAILAKFMLLGHAMKLGDSGKLGPLIWPTLYGAVIFMLLLVALTIIEEIVVGFFHGRSVTASLGDLTGPHLGETAAGIVIIFLVLIPYFAFRVLAMSLGTDRLMQMFFGDSARFILR
jgi:hypothetical protein